MLYWLVNQVLIFVVYLVLQVAVTFELSMFPYDVSTVMTAILLVIICITVSLPLIMPPRCMLMAVVSMLLAIC